MCVSPRCGAPHGPPVVAHWARDPLGADKPRCCAARAPWLVPWVPDPLHTLVAAGETSWAPVVAHWVQVPLSVDGQRPCAAGAPGLALWVPHPLRALATLVVPFPLTAGLPLLRKQPIWAAGDTPHLMPVEQGLPWHPVATGLAGQAIPSLKTRLPQRAGRHSSRAVSHETHLSYALLPAPQQRLVSNRGPTSANRRQLLVSHRQCGRPIQNGQCTAGTCQSTPAAQETSLIGVVVCRSRYFCGNVDPAAHRCSITARMASSSCFPCGHSKDQTEQRRSR